MSKLKSLCLAAAAFASFTGCGRSSTQLADNAPSYSTMSMDMEDSDSTPDQQALGIGDACHPHLFLRTRNMVRRLNHHTLKVLAKMDAVIDAHPNAQSGDSATWIKTFGDLSIKVVGTKVAADQYSFETDVKRKADADSAYVKVGSATVAKTDGTAHTGKGTLSVDLTALKGVDSRSTAEGTLTVNFDISATTKTLEVTLANFLPDDGLKGPDGNDLLSPRDTHYVFTRAPGVGGSLKFTDEMILLCPQNDALARSSVDVVARWAKTSAGKRVARADALATGGPIAAGDRVVGITCADYSSGDAAAERYWMMKLEDSAGTTVRAGQVFKGALGAETCDPLFGAVPSETDASNDYDFTKINFADSSTVPFPGSM